MPLSGGIIVMIKQNDHNVLLWIGKLHAVSKLLVSLLIAFTCFLIIPGGLYSRLHFMICWDIFSFAMILLSWISFFTISSHQIRELSRQQDESRFIIFVLVVISTLASLSAVFLLLAVKSNNFQLLAAIIGMLLSWILIQTIFAFRYAHLYYGNDEENKQVHAGGLEFPGDKKPDYLDFAYFSFVLGMTFQVSDVQITSKRLRRLSLLHGLISFLFNTFIVALTINAIAGLREKG